MELTWQTDWIASSGDCRVEERESLSCNFGSRLFSLQSQLGLINLERRAEQKQQNRFASFGLLPHSANYTPMDPPLGNISPLAPRDPLPGQQNGHFRPQSVSPSPQNSPWSSNPLSGGDPESQEGGFGSPTQREYQSPQQGARGFVARAPTGERSLERERATQREQNGQENVRRSAEGNGGTGELGFVRVKVVGLEKNRRDIYVKFNAEVRPYLHQYCAVILMMRLAYSRIYQLIDPRLIDQSPVPSAPSKPSTSPSPSPILRRSFPPFRSPKVAPRRRRRMIELSNWNFSVGSGESVVIRR